MALQRIDFTIGRINLQFQNPHLPTIDTYTVEPITKGCQYEKTNAISSVGYIRHELDSC